MNSTHAGPGLAPGSKVKKSSVVMAMMNSTVTKQVEALIGGENLYYGGTLRETHLDGTATVTLDPLRLSVWNAPDLRWSTTTAMWSECR